MEATSHNIDNILIRLNGDQADVESYYQGYHSLRHGETVSGSLQAGRYLDRFEKRNDEWRITRRKVVVDWFRECADAGDWRIGPHGHSEIKPGGRYPADDSYSLLNLV